jgi:RNA polymerase sigma-70 factor (ECF subfamily)
VSRKQSKAQSCADDDSLLLRVGQGDTLAFEHLYESYASSFYSVARAILKDPSRSADAAQEIFLTIWNQAAQYDPQRGHARSWLLTIAHRKAIDALRRQRGPAAKPLVDEAISPENVAQSVVDRLCGADVLSRTLNLNSSQREVLFLAYYGGLTQQEICDILGVPLGTVKTRMRDGMQKIRMHVLAEIPRAEVATEIVKVFRRPPRSCAYRPTLASQ